MAAGGGRNDVSVKRSMFELNLMPFINIDEQLYVQWNQTVN